MPHKDEFYCQDHRGNNIEGRWTAQGYFKVKEEDRPLLGDLCDESGYLLDQDRQRMHNNKIGSRVKQRRDQRRAEYMKPQEDEFY